MATKKVTVDTSFDEEARQADGAPLVVKLAGTDFTVVDNPPVGAVVVFSRRLHSGDETQQMAAVLELLERWVEPDEHDALYDAVAVLDTEGLTRFFDTDLAHAVQAIAHRPT